MNRETGPGAECWCGCGRTIPNGRRHDARYVDGTHKRRRERQRLAERVRQGQAPVEAGTGARDAQRRPMRLALTIDEESAMLNPAVRRQIPENTTISCHRGSLMVVKPADNSGIVISRGEGMDVLNLDPEEAAWLADAVLPLMVSA